MKITLTFMVLTALVVTPQRLLSPKEKEVLTNWRALCEPYISECMCESKPDGEIVNNFFEYGELSNDPCFKCNVRCWGRKVDVWTNSGNVNMTNFKNKVFGVTEEISQKCGRIYHVDTCQQAFNIMRCVWAGIFSGDTRPSELTVSSTPDAYVYAPPKNNDWSPLIQHISSSFSPTNFLPPEESIILDGTNLTTDMLLRLGNGQYKIRLSKEAEEGVVKARTLIENILKENKVVYGITTGFGNFARVNIPTDKLEELQYNLIRSHAAGVGNPLSPAKTRMLLALRINVLAKGYSGISLKSLQCLIDTFNASCLSWVPEQGSVGASGDLAPLAHLALGIIGEGQMWSPETGWASAKEVLKAHGLQPMRLGPKEGIALINGTQLITSIGAEAVERAMQIARQADVVAALTLEVLKGTSRAFDSDVQMIRPHKGQIAVAKRLRALLHSDTYPSQIAESHRFCNRVQDAYTLRCCPQVHGVVHDTIEFVQNVISTEMNSGTDNPIVFAERGEIISAGNFHGEYPAKVLDYLAIGVHELASMSERRVERLVNPALSGLPAFLVHDGGINSGFMLAHCTAASLVSENKVLCHPSSVDSLSTSAGQEDHVSMGCYSARKAIQVVENVEHVIAIELLAACQAIEFLRPLKTTAPLEEVYCAVRKVVRPWDKDRYMAPDIDAVKKLLMENKIWSSVQHHITFYHAPEERETRVFSPTAYSLGGKQRDRPSSKSRTLKRKLTN